MAIKGLRKIEADIIRLKATAAAEAGILVRYSDTVDAKTGLPKVSAATSGDSKVVGLLGDKVIARPAQAEDSSDTQLAGIKSDWIFSEAQPMFQEEGLRFVDEEVFIIRRGMVRTDQLARGAVPSGGLLAWAAEGGTVGAAVTGSGAPIGTWQSASDTAGFAELYVDTVLARQAG